MAALDAFATRRVTAAGCDNAGMPTHDEILKSLEAVIDPELRRVDRRARHGALDRAPATTARSTSPSR